MERGICMKKETVQSITNYMHRIYKQYNFTDFDNQKKEILEIIKITKEKEREPIQTNSALVYGKNIPILVQFSKKTLKEIKGRKFWVSKVKIIHMNVGINDQLSLLEETYVEAQPDVQGKDVQRTEPKYQVVEIKDLDKKMAVIKRKA